MAGQEFQYISDILKEFYTPAIINQLWKKSILWALLKKKTSDMVGKRVVIPVRVGLTEAVGARASNDYTLPTAQKNLYDQAYIYMKRMYGRVMVDGFSIESAKGKGGWVDVLQAEIQGVTDAFTIDMERQLHGNGCGMLAYLAAGYSTTTIAVDSPGGIAVDTDVTKYLRAGQVVDIYDSDCNPIHATAAIIASVSKANGTATFTGGGAVTSVEDNDIIFKQGAYGAADAIGEMMGIDGICAADNNGTTATYMPLGTDFEGIEAVTAQPSWQAYVTSTGAVLSELVIQNDLDAIDNGTDGDPVDLILTTPALRNKLITLTKTMYMTETLDLVAGWKAIKYVGGAKEIPVITTKFCPITYMYYLSRPHLTLYLLKNLVWDDKGGGVVKPIAGSDAYEAWFKLYGNFGTDCRNAHGKHSGLTTA